jgi:hypothetical protein
VRMDAGGVVTRLAALAAGVVTVFTAVPAVGAAAEEVAIPRLTWSDCQDGFQCATAKVPLDYDLPAGTKIDLALIKLPAPDQARKIGTLFVNFGGPGGSGLQRLRERAKWPYLFSDELRTRFDLVSWDPRGIGNSTAVRCFGTLVEQQAFLGSFPEMPVDPSGEPAFYAKSRELAERCRDNAGEIVEHVSTANTARDLDVGMQCRRTSGFPTSGG